MRMNKTTDYALIEIEVKRRKNILNKLGRRLKKDLKESNRDTGSQRRFNIFTIGITIWKLNQGIEFDSAKFKTSWNKILFEIH